MDITSSDTFASLAALMWWINTPMLVILLILSVGSVQLRVWFVAANAPAERARRYDYLRLARVGRLVFLGAIILIFLLQDIFNSIAFNNQFVREFNEGLAANGSSQFNPCCMSYEGTGIIDPSCVYPGFGYDLIWLILGWVSFGLVTLLFIMQLIARPWLAYERTVAAFEDGVEADFQELERKLEATEEENRRLNEELEKYHPEEE